MNLAELRAEIEQDRAWRDKEIRDFQNRGSTIQDQDELNRYRRALVLLLYAHYEGFCKFTFALYVSAVNRENLTCAEASYAIAAASLAQVFRDLGNPQKKSDIFRNALPDDFKLHRFAREREFVERTSEVNQRRVEIPDSVVDTESNLSPVVLRKLLFQLGLPHAQFDNYAPQIHKLLKMRNGISHGELKDGVEENIYDNLRLATSSVMTGLGSQVMKALTDGAYSRSGTGVPASGV